MRQLSIIPLPIPAPFWLITSKAIAQNQPEQKYNGLCNQYYKLLHLSKEGDLNKLLIIKTSSLNNSTENCSHSMQWVEIGLLSRINKFTGFILVLRRQ